ncbi:Glycosyl hydrolase family 92 [Posidoniimonas polymericola]|uniref:Glycosyl hydrolase family 92 n=1 Tax=Posidoniimonas polymericola TaxID=2528002 RepID=A0A5C5YRD9_9BACT|nr:GH92 family glycosyl hydrolase [Posidoniimonas polymericola]TWT77408.1 Glycosyl hydrolase family 92 [Posidoniimonas polymericola]
MNAARVLAVLTSLALCAAAGAQQRPVDLVDPFLGTAPLTDPADIGFEPPYRVWAGLTFPGASRPNAMVQLSPMTEYRSGAGYEYEDERILAFTHTNKGHWNLCYLPVLPVTGEIDTRREGRGGPRGELLGSRFRHEEESASPGYYRVRLDDYGVDAELTSTLRCGLHRYRYPAGQEAKIVFDIARSNERVRDFELEQDGFHAVSGFQQANEKVYFYATVSRDIEEFETIDLGRGRWGRPLKVLRLAAGDEPVELRIGLSFVSVENARRNLEAELDGRSFDEVRREATDEWSTLLSKAEVAGGTPRQRGLYYSCLYRSFLWPALRSDANGEFTDAQGRVVRKEFRYYTKPSLWDDYRNKLVLLAMLSPDVTADVISSLVDRGEIEGYMPTFFHGDHAAPYIAGCYLRGVRGYDVHAAYQLLKKNATVPGRGGRPHLREYDERGYIATPPVDRPEVETKAKAGVTKTLEYAYDDYAVGLLARELGDGATRLQMEDRVKNYANVFDPATGLMRGRLDDGQFVTPFDPEQPYYEYMYREANAWQSTFFAPHDTAGLVELFGGKQACEAQLDRLFTIPWNPRHIARNVSCFLGQYCHGNQPDHGFPYVYYWVDRQEKCQAVLNTLMDRFYGMAGGHALCGMDDAGEMSSWYVMNAIGLYSYSPADPEYVVTVPLFDEVKLTLPNNTVTIKRRGAGEKIRRVTLDGTPLDGWIVTHDDLTRAGELVIEAEATRN